MSYPQTLSLAPMLDWTDRHFRYFIRLLSPNTVLYTEMITTGAILHGDADRHLQFNRQETPVVLQLGGSDPQALATCAKIAVEYGYDEVNLNVGCPSDRVQNGKFGACLMNDPELVAICVEAMKSVVDIPVTVKTRIGVDENDSYEALHKFIDASSIVGCMHFIIHARKAWLKGLSPKENRTIPPLDYETVYRLKKDFPELFFTINGGVETLVDIQQHLSKVDGVMLGRVACQNPWVFVECENLVFGTEQSATRKQMIEQYIPYCEQQLEKNIRLSALIRPILCLFNGMKGAKQWRRHLSTYAPRQGSGVEIIVEALKFVDH